MDKATIHYQIFIQPIEDWWNDRKGFNGFFTGLLVGWAIGLFIFGWWLTPVEYTNLDYRDIRKDLQLQYIYLVLDWYENNQAPVPFKNAHVKNLLESWNGHDLVCQEVSSENDIEMKQGLLRLVIAIDPNGCKPQ